MKPLCIILTTWMFWSLNANTVHAQLDESILINGKEVFLHKDNLMNIRSLLIRQVEDKVYLSWVAENQKCDGTFIVYRSSDGQNFEIIGVQQAVKTPDNNAVGYGFIDNVSVPYGQVYYKIMHLGTDNSFYVSNEVHIKFPVLNFVNSYE